MVTPTKKPSKRTYKSSYASSDEDYAGVELISDTEEDEPDVEVAEEQAIIESEEEEEDDDDDLQDTPRPSADGDHPSWNGFDVESENEYPENSHFDEHMALTHESIYDQDMSPARHVRFALDSSDSDSDNELTPEPLIKDLFIDQDLLDPSFRRMIEKDDENSSGNESYWDYNDNEDTTFSNPAKADSSEDSSTGSSGYECKSQLVVTVFGTNYKQLMTAERRLMKNFHLQLNSFVHVLYCLHQMSLMTLLPKKKSP